MKSFRPLLRSSSVSGFPPDVIGKTVRSDVIEASKSQNLFISLKCKKTAYQQMFFLYYPARKEGYFASIQYRNKGDQEYPVYLKKNLSFCGQEKILCYLPISYEIIVSYFFFGIYFMSVEVLTIHRGKMQSPNKNLGNLIYKRLTKENSPKNSPYKNPLSMNLT